MRKTRFFILGSLVFYFLVISCTEKKEPGSVSIQWEGDKPVAIIVPQQFLSSISRDSVKELLQIRLANSSQEIIGDYSFADDDVVFKPIIAFRRGLKYNVYVRDKLIDEIKIQAGETKAPEIVAVYPASDTLPENLLKFYISFSKPMQEGDVLRHIHLIKDDKDTLSSVFFDMEFWNNERTMLTLWLDPGRIKRDLQPNKLLGPPLTKGSRYQLVIDKKWQDAEGILLKESLSKKFLAGPHDGLSPDINRWTIDVPTAGAKGQLKINFHESLDHVLAENAMLIKDVNGNELKGRFQVDANGIVLYFFPNTEWIKGDYVLQIASSLEDLAGNNLDRLFDTDLTREQRSLDGPGIHQRKFEIR